MQFLDKQVSFENCVKASEALHQLSRVLIFEFVRRDPNSGLRNQITRNFIARADLATTNIFSLWASGDRTDCWTLHRSLLDRLFHLHEISRTGQFENFDDWSFKTQVNAANNLRSDPDLAGQVDGLVAELTPEQKQRYNKLRDEKIWRRPRAEDVAREMDLLFLYRYGYDYASRYVHPMSDDGLEDFRRLAGMPPLDLEINKNTTILSNSVLCATLTIQEALNASTLHWMKVIYDTVECVRQFLADTNVAQHLPLLKISQMAINNQPLSKLA